MMIFSSFRLGSALLNVSKCGNTFQRQSRTLFINPDPKVPVTMTNQDVIDAFAKSSGSANEYSPGGVKDSFEQRKLLMDLLPKDRSELPARRMKDSFTSAVIPLATNIELRNRYITRDGHVRIGRLLEDIDVFAVWVCVQHIKNPRSEGKDSPYSIVTGLVDSIHLPFLNEPTFAANQDIIMSGHVSWVGTTSLEASVQLDQLDQNGQYQQMLDAVFLLVSRNPINAGSALVNPLVADTPEEEAYINLGNERNRIRKLSLTESLIKKPPNQEERSITHRLFMSTVHPDYVGWEPAHVPPNTVAMPDTALNTLLLCHPQYRNRYNKVFGGFIMRQACELAYSQAFVYSKERPHLLNIDDIVFRKPVEIGSLIRFKAMIGYVEDNYMHVPVMAEVINPETGAKNVTNVFQFTFISNLSGNNPIPAVVPTTYQEAMTYLQSRRHFIDMMAERKA